LVCLFLTNYSNAQYASNDFVDRSSLKINYIEITQEEAIKKYNLPEDLPTWLMNDLVRIHSRIENVDALGATKAELIAYKTALTEKEKEILELKTALDANNTRLDDMRDFGLGFIGIISLLSVISGYFSYVNAGTHARAEVVKGVQEAKSDVIKGVDDTKNHYLEKAKSLIDSLESETKSASTTLKNLSEKEKSVLDEISELENLKNDTEKLLSELKVERSRISEFEEKIEHLQNDISKFKKELASSDSEKVFKGGNNETINEEHYLSMIRNFSKKLDENIDE
ncbi:hypothetical protein DY884_24955, partial [Vibrio parahaemolyticus]|nr:hypothetical protein [Vibrio parahaemolyticus]